MTFDPHDPSRLTMWVIYFDPSDYPGLYVVRAQQPTSEGVLCDPGCATYDTLEEARAFMASHLFCMPRDPNDDPKIVEVWF